MSGFAGVFHLDGAPADRAWLETMAGFLAFRGPDSSQVWVSENSGLCHTLLSVAREMDGRPQIASLDGSLWIAADARASQAAPLWVRFYSDEPSWLDWALGHAGLPPTEQIIAAGQA